MAAGLFVRFFFWLWFAAAIALGHFRTLERLPPTAIPLMVFGTAGALIYAYFRLPALRTWVDALDLRALVLLHVTRFVGIYFLVLHQRGELPRAFAVPAGIGDIVVATMALPVALAPLTADTRHRAVTIWNVVGFVDILLVAVTAARLNLADPAQMWAFRHLPLSLLPTFLVPLIIATHVIIFVRIARTQRAA
jgi:hypothetical protein